MGKPKVKVKVDSKGMRELEKQLKKVGKTIDKSLEKELKKLPGQPSRADVQRRLDRGFRNAGIEPNRRETRRVAEEIIDAAEDS